MRLTCRRISLLTACQSVATAVPSRTTKEVMSCVKVTHDGSTVTVLAHDGELGIRSSFDGEGSPGEMLLPHQQLTDILRNASEDTVTITGRVVTVGRSRYELADRPVDEFPEPPELSEDGSFKIPAAELEPMIRRTQFAIARQETGGRFVLRGMLWEVAGNTLTLVGTDTKRLATAEATILGEARDVSAMVPVKAVNALLKNMDGSDMVRVCLTAHGAVFATERATISTSLVAGRFPPFRDIIKGVKNTTQIVLPRGDFEARVRQAAVVTDDESVRVDFAFSAGVVAMSARGADTGSAAVEMELPGYDGAALEIAFDPHFLTEYLRAVDDAEQVTMHVIDGGKPVVFAAGDGSQCLIMPLAN